MNFIDNRFLKIKVLCNRDGHKDYYTRIRLSSIIKYREALGGKFKGKTRITTSEIYSPGQNHSADNFYFMTDLSVEELDKLFEVSSSKEFRKAA